MDSSNTIVIQTESGEFRMNKISNLAELDKAAEFVLNMRKTASRRELVGVASYILGRCAALDGDMNTAEMRKIAHIAGMGVGDRSEIEAEFDKRAGLNMLGRGAESFWNYSNTMKSLSDAEFYKTANLNTICNVIEDIDKHYNNTHRYGKDLKAPEDVVYKDTADDLLKQANDLLYVESIDATLSKEAVLERAGAINKFFAEYTNMNTPLTGDNLLDKVAHLDSILADELLATLERDK